jgi:uncharacterized protein YcaQ
VAIPRTSADLSAAQARRIALAAQGFGRPAAATGTRQLNLLVQKLGLLQLDSVNVFERSHYLPVFARLGHYDKNDLDRLTFARKSAYTEYWAHEAAIIPVENWPLFRWRMEARRERWYGQKDSWVRDNAVMLDWLRAELRDKGPIAASEIQHDSGKGEGGWWGWSSVKLGLEYLFGWGEVVSAGRTRFERTYALAEQKLPASVLEQQVSETDAVRRLMALSARAHGVGTLRDLADYYRIKQAPAALALLDLVDSGDVVPVTVDGWKQQAYLHRDARIPRSMNAGALLSPFDPVVWERGRAERMFDFHYRIEIYTPEPKRVFGYYSLPILIDDALVGRIDLKNDRQNRVLRVQSAWREAHAPAGIEVRIVPLLESTRAWQALDTVEFTGRGDLSASLEAAWNSRGN